MQENPPHVRQAGVKNIIFIPFFQRRVSGLQSYTRIYLLFTYDGIMMLFDYRIPSYGLSFAIFVSGSTGSTSSDGRVELV